MAAQRPTIFYAYDPAQRTRFLEHETSPVLMEKAADEAVWLPPADADVIVCSLASWAKAPRTSPPGWPFGIRYIQFASAGVDTLPDWARSVAHVASVRGVTAEPIAEYVMAAILADCKRLDALDHFARTTTENAFDERTWPSGSMRSLKGQTLGLLGYGAIGQAVARRAEAFGMEIIALRRSPQSDRSRFVATVEELVARSDQLVLCAPSTAETRHILNDRTFAAMKPSAHLINVARGALVDHDALSRALDAGRLRYATLDVTDPEPLPSDHPLLTSEKVRITPHAAWFSHNHFDRVTTKLLQNLGRYVKGEPLADVADFSRGY